VNAYQVYEHLKAQAAKDQVLGRKGTLVPLDQLQTLLDGIDLDDDDHAANVADLVETQEDRDEWKAETEKWRKRCEKADVRANEAQQQLFTIKDLATEWANSEPSPANYAADIRRAAELLLAIIR
jgi:outer membrane biogenesis lipoprotein LolB